MACWHHLHLQSRARRSLERCNPRVWAASKWSTRCSRNNKHSRLDTWCFRTNTSLTGNDNFADILDQEFVRNKISRHEIYALKAELKLKFRCRSALHISSVISNLAAQFCHISRRLDSLSSRYLALPLYLELRLDREDQREKQNNCNDETTQLKGGCARNLAAWLSLRLRRMTAIFGCSS